MYWTEKHVLVCTASHCSQKGATDVVGKLRLEMVRKGLGNRILVNNCGTIDLCDCGPNIIVYPDNIIYSAVTVKDIPEILVHLQGGPVVERLLIDSNTPAERNRQNFYAAVTADGPIIELDRFVSTAARFGLEDDWIAEQMRRGFTAKKEIAELGEAVVVTHKALDRYGLGQ